MVKEISQLKITKDNGNFLIKKTNNTPSVDPNSIECLRKKKLNVNWLFGSSGLNGNHTWKTKKGRNLDSNRTRPLTVMNINKFINIKQKKNQKMLFGTMKM